MCCMYCSCVLYASSVFLSWACLQCACQAELRDWFIPLKRRKYSHYKTDVTSSTGLFCVGVHVVLSRGKSDPVSLLMICDRSAAGHFNELPHCNLCDSFKWLIQVINKYTSLFCVLLSSSSSMRPGRAADEGGWSFLQQEPVIKMVSDFPSGSSSSLH